MTNKRTEIYKKRSNKRKTLSLRGRKTARIEAAHTEIEVAHTEIEATPEVEIEAAPLASTWVEAVDEKEVSDEKEKGVEDKFPTLCLECSVQIVFATL